MVLNLLNIKKLISQWLMFIHCMLFFVTVPLIKDIREFYFIQTKLWILYLIVYVSTQMAKSLGCFFKL